MENPVCTSCGAVRAAEELTEFDGQLLCPTCLERETVVCSCCGDRIWEEDNAGTSGRPLCQNCYDESYTTCERCGRLIHRDDAFYHNDAAYCGECYADYYSNDRTIQDYYHKPVPIFYGEGKRYFGVELEVDGAGEDDDNAYSVQCAANRNGLEHVYIKHDGSLDDGFEIVTHPMTLEYHLHEMPWKAVTDEARALGYLSHKANTCGLHIHVNRNSLGETYEEQEAVIARILYFFEKHWEELLKFSRRTSRQLERWAARYGYKEHPKEILDHAKKGNAGRYTSVNLCNADTIEFRMFRGTLKYNTILATLQLVNRVCEAACSLPDEMMKGVSWTSFVSGCAEPELVQYLKERRLYVNDPVEAEEDD